ncbi:hypothetical protein B0T26DRAFT_355199 [Lasiosphaeria miniovina]|uniref:Uncharacterized protein n=1 Tax=Lasiosphaeria miniovina TaxID=1954250 RepID=A0AA40DRP5_9PEZI|nr:uncharacterized protein B0T26DRAFT_355199 [Lasiosphaeria miniovina]KAK0713090.1 hypothetical protein B0T26DRAFT_355199 [Lasiosphaeria miniovina]
MHCKIGSWPIVFIICCVILIAAIKCVLTTPYDVLLMDGIVDIDSVDSNFLPIQNAFEGSAHSPNDLDLNRVGFCLVNCQSSAISMSFNRPSGHVGFGLLTCSIRNSLIALPPNQFCDLLATVKAATQRSHAWLLNVCSK